MRCQIQMLHSDALTIGLRTAPGLLVNFLHRRPDSKRALQPLDLHIEESCARIVSRQPPLHETW